MFNDENTIAGHYKLTDKEAKEIDLQIFMKLVDAKKYSDVIDTLFPALTNKEKYRILTLMLTYHKKQIMERALRQFNR